MLDVHAPSHSLGGPKDFFVHLITITIGLLIAVGIEGCVERHHQHELVKEARATIREEVQANADTLRKAVKEIGEAQTRMSTNIAALKAIQEDPKGKKTADLSSDYGLTSVNNTAWKTAIATNALAYMPYKEAERYNDIYASQQAFEDQEQKIVEDSSLFFGLVRRFNLGKADITKEQADAMQERFGIWQGHLLYLDLLAKVSLDQDESFLAGRDAAKSMHENVKD